MSKRTGMNTYPRPATVPVPRVSYTVEEAAAALGVGRTFLFALVKRGDLEVVRLGRRTLVPAASLDALIQRHLDMIKQMPLPAFYS